MSFIFSEITFAEEHPIVMVILIALFIWSLYVNIRHHDEHIPCVKHPNDRSYDYCYKQDDADTDGNSNTEDKDSK